ncbi:MAG: ATP-binding cassette domain-containing protein [Desulfovibrio sp.]|nr:ATP-binding cassette domain-containing protein [Desulfovibrio sp.]
MQPLVAIRSLCRDFRRAGGLSGRRRPLRAVREVSLDLFPGQTLGVVGESGSGKSTLGRMAVGLLPPSAGEIRIRGLALYGKGKLGLPPALAGAVQMIFQDPYSSLNPRMRVGRAVEEPLLWSGPPAGRGERLRRVEAMLEQVGLDARQARAYPHELSGGQRQRVAIARALITRPVFVVCDEPTSSLDASVQAQVLNLLKDLQDALGVAYLFISHDLAVIRHMADRVAVMYRGLVVEEADAADLFGGPRHPYTRLLLGAAPEAVFPGRPSPGEEDRPICPFGDRCPQALPLCLAGPLPPPAGNGHLVRCLAP